MVTLSLMTLLKEGFTNDFNQGHVAAAWKLKANWFATQNQKTMVNNELPLFKRTNQERPYEQLIHEHFNQVDYKIS